MPNESTAKKYLRGEVFLLQQQARQAVAKAIANGTLKRPTRCSKCESTRPPIQAHHEDYERPLDVTWLCAPCHGEVHKAKREAIRVEDNLTKVTFKIPKELDEAIELQAHQWRMQKREAAIILLEDALKRPNKEYNEVA